MAWAGDSQHNLPSVTWKPSAGSKSGAYTPSVQLQLEDPVCLKLYLKISKGKLESRVRVLRGTWDRREAEKHCWSGRADVVVRIKVTPGRCVRARLIRFITLLLLANAHASANRQGFDSDSLLLGNPPIHSPFESQEEPDAYNSKADWKN